MQLGKTLDIASRKEWREWLEKNHAKEKEIWLIYYRKATGQIDEVEFVVDKAGTFEYYCSVGNHRQMGMVGKLIVE